MGSAPGISPSSAVMATRAGLDRGFDTAIAIAQQTAAPSEAVLRIAPTTSVIAERSRLSVEAIELGTPKAEAERAHRPLRPLLDQKSIGTNSLSATFGTPLLQLSPQSRLQSAEAAANARMSASALGLCALTDLPEGVYFTVAFHLDACALCEVDATCRAVQVLNQSHHGPWHTLGARRFRGIELETDGIFDVADAPEPKAALVVRAQDASKSGFSDGVHSDLGGIIMSAPLCNKLRHVGWKGRYLHFQQRLPTFQLPFSGPEIRQVQNQDEVVNCSCMLRGDLLCKGSATGVYIEFVVVSNADNLSLAVVDFEAGGSSSVTFSPDTGAVIRERTVRDMPRKVEGAYVQPLASTLPRERFEGSVGLYLYAGHLAFFRRCASDATEQEPGLWESTGFVTDLSWAEGRCLRPCLAFRDEGPYHIKIVTVDSAPPVALGNPPEAYDETRWSSLDWEAEDSEL